MQVETQPNSSHPSLNTIKLVVSKEDYTSSYEKTLKKYSKQVSLNGFRKGMAPIGLVKKMYGNSILAEEVNKLIDNQIRTYFKENKVEILGTAIPSENSEDVKFDYNNLTDYTFTFDYLVAPEIDFNFNKTFTNYQVTLNTDSIDKEIDRAKEYFKESKEVEDGIIEGDFFNFELKNNADFSKSSSASWEELTEEGQAAFGGKKVDDTISGFHKSFFKDEKIYIKYILEISENQAEEKKDLIEGTFDAKITKVTRSTVPDELSAEQIAQITKDETKNTLEDLKQFFRAELDNQYKNLAKNVLKNEISSYIFNELELDLPDHFILKLINGNSGNPITEKEFEKDKPAIYRQIKWQLVEASAMKSFDIKLTKEDFNNYLNSYFSAQLSSYGMPISPEYLDYFIKSAEKDKKKMQQHFENYSFSKILDALSEKIQLEDKIVSEEEIKEIVKDWNEKYA